MLSLLYLLRMDQVNLVSAYLKNALMKDLRILLAKTSEQLHIHHYHAVIYKPCDVVLSLEA